MHSQSTFVVVNQAIAPGISSVRLGCLIECSWVVEANSSQNSPTNPAGHRHFPFSQRAPFAQLILLQGSGAYVSHNSPMNSVEQFVDIVIWISSESYEIMNRV